MGPNGGFEIDEMLWYVSEVPVRKSKLEGPARVFRDFWENTESELAFKEESVATGWGEDLCAQRCSSRKEGKHETS